MDKSLKFSVPFLPPSANNIHFNMVRRGKIVRCRTYAYKQFIRHYKSFASRDIVLCGGKDWPFDDRQALKIQIDYVSDKWLTKEKKLSVRDLDNRVKPLLDAIKMAIGIKDHRYSNIVASKIVGIGDKTNITILPCNIKYIKEQLS